MPLPRWRRSPSACRRTRCGTALPPTCLEQNTDIRVIQVLLGHAKLDTTALYTHVATNTIRDGHEPVGSAHAAEAREERAARITPGAHGAPRPGGRGYLPRPRAGLA